MTALAATFGLSLPAAPAHAYLLAATSPGGTTNSLAGCGGTPAFQILNCAGPTPITSSGYTPFVPGYPQGYGSASADLAGKIKVYAKSDGVAAAGIAEGQVAAPIYLIDPCSLVHSSACTTPTGTFSVSLYLSGTYATTLLGIPGQESEADISASLGLSGGASPSWYGSWSEGASGSIEYVLTDTAPLDFVHPIIVAATVAITAHSLSEIDLSHTATFGITLPDGVTYTSPFSFPGATVATVAEPATMAMLSVAFLALGAARRRGSVSGE